MERLSVPVSQGDAAQPYLPTAAARQKGQADKPKTPIRRWTFAELPKLTLDFAPPYALCAFLMVFR